MSLSERFSTVTVLDLNYTNQKAIPQLEKGGLRPTWNYWTLFTQIAAGDCIWKAGKEETNNKFEVVLFKTPLQTRKSSVTHFWWGRRWWLCLLAPQLFAFPLQRTTSPQRYPSSTLTWSWRGFCPSIVSTIILHLDILHLHFPFSTLILFWSLDLWFAIMDWSPAGNGNISFQRPTSSPRWPSKRSSSLPYHRSRTEKTCLE